MNGFGTAPLVTVIIVNFRTPDLTAGCLESLRPELHPGVLLRVVVVENGSGDDSFDRLGAFIRERGWDWVDLVESETNLGFAGGNALGLARADRRSDIVLFLNNDTISAPGAIGASAKVVLDDPTIGAFSCRLEFPSGALQVVARPMPTPWRLIVAQTGLPWFMPRLFGWAQPEYLRWDLDHVAGEPGWIGGAFYMMPGGLAFQLGGFSKEFFFYGEDIELSHRVRRCGYRLVYDPLVSVTHLGGASSDPSRLPEGARSEAQWRARYIVQRMCYGRLAALAVRGADVLFLKLRSLKAQLGGDAARAKELAASCRAAMASGAAR